MSQFSMEELRDMAPAYVLGALSADEYAAFDGALATSTELAKEVTEFRAITERIASEQQIAPSPELRARFLERIATTQNITGAPPEKTATSAVDVPVRPFTVSTGNPSAPTTAPKSTTSGNWWLNGVLGTALAASLVFAVQQNSQVTKLNTTLAQQDSAAKVRELKLTQRDTTLETIFEAERDLVVVHLVGDDKAGAGIQVMWNLKQGRGVLNAFRLKPAASGRAYQLWLIKDGKPVASKVFNSDRDGHSLMWDVDMPTNTTGITALAITEEPSGGSQQPTTKPFMIGELPKGL